MAQDTSSFSSLINLGLVQDAPDNIRDPEVRALYTSITNSLNNFIRYVEQYCGITTKDITQWSALTPNDTILPQNLRRLYVKASVDLAYGTFVNLFDSGTDLQAQKSSSVTPLVAHGYVNTAAGILTGEYGEIILMEGIVTITGVTRGTSYFIAAAGLISNVVGVKKQFVGFGVAPDTLAVCIDRSAF